ncbi:tetratricopeptide repeat protein [Longimicrobium terrae]|uniref:Flp pilus assembly protein TadD n=1 Tax=Longimicrobium terrae TaxID=1639882 RepID=A0A841H0Z8_9BACT|nr:tetratricopeptide repeat protein [Longimicrobium terrae]MBB4637106.1 Flp pilus assembly protein TadD [Longimicrobium terrae]MBB6071634.1 Flp pilus assembly protein TadD [Longimicrobium terrae]NNC29950.1 tetratricopeptide repeat protein [Longimicrobium terrae]
MGTSFLSSEEYDELAHKYYDTGDYDQALDVLRDGIAQYPDSVLLQVGLGYTRIAREEYAWARQCFERALELDSEYEDAWVGLGETLLKFGRVEDALSCFAQIDEMGLGDDLELGLTVGRALYREGLFTDARARFAALSTSHADSAELAAARGYTLHALGDDLGARRELRRALKLDAELHEARIYLSHLLHDRGDLRGALTELEQVPPAEHWDTLSIWRYIELKTQLDGVTEDDGWFAPWRDTLAELDDEPDDVDHLLAEVEASFEGVVDEQAAAALELSAQMDFMMKVLGPNAPVPVAEPEAAAHRIRTAEGSVFEGSWDDIVGGMRDACGEPALSLGTFMRRAARQIHERTGRDVPSHSAEAFLKASARMGLLRIER